MAQFLGVHRLEADMSLEDVQSGFNKYKEEAAKIGIKALYAHYSLEKGLLYCLTEADSADQVRAAHQNISIPLEDVIEVREVE